MDTIWKTSVGLFLMALGWIIFRQARSLPEALWDSLSGVIGFGIFISSGYDWLNAGRLLTELRSKR